MGLKLGYIGLTIATVIFLIWIGKTAIQRTSLNKSKDMTLLVTALFFWQAFIFLVASSGILKSYDFPPRFAMFFILPSFIFIGVFLHRNKNKDWIQAIPPSRIIYFQTFRVLVETLFVLSVAKGILHPLVTIEGYNVDMVFAATAPIIAFLVYTKKILPRKTVLLWNYLGLAIIASIIFLFMTSIYKPELWGKSEPMLPMDMLTYPYVLIAGFLMPVAVFLHILSIVQIKKSL
ncbi:hypothetical protein ACOKFD_14980 [Flagellimonas sp. S174]|uniref:hypothetical protein n=1 Tax=Flagellimonas sp. S174 TaxID=3410790 RepID=UPI003BF4C7A6